MPALKSSKKIYKTPEPGNEIVISGIAGRFPESKNVEELKDNLLNKVDLVTDDNRRWELDHPEIPHRTGKINDIGKFDALFFGVHFKQAHTMDPMCRMLLEHAYEAVVDAGVNPKQLRGSRTGVFIGACFSESEKTWFYEKLQVNGFGITGCSRAMLANRISYWLGVIGPSYTVDSACSSSLVALEHAYRSICDGQCDAAIVGGSNLCLHPYVSLQFSRLGVLSPDGRSKAFDADADGYARSETVSVIFLQKAKNARRIYATLVYGKANCDGYKEQGITFPSSKMQGILMKECYEDCGIPTSDLVYLECHGSGTKVGDPEEINAIENIICKDRTTPLLIGSVKSNMGHSEPASGLCQVVKMIIAMETGLIPPNLHYNRPREGLKALGDGRLKVITEPTPWDGGYVGINSFGFGGANCHVILKSNPKKKINNGAPTDDLPRLVVVSGRTEESIKVFLDDIERHPIDTEYIHLLHDIHSEDIQGHLYRGYTVIGSKTADRALRESENYLGTVKPLWFVFSGMGSQWPGMGTDLMRFPVFAEAIKKCDAVLRPRGVDIINILTNKDKTIFDNILHSFVGIAAVQIGLVDLLTSMGIVPDNIIGHSVGELGCAYADGCFTAEQMILSAYSRGLASIETEVIYGSMAAVGLGYEDIKDMCPPDIEVACHNAADSSTISGPAESMKEFVAQLQAKQIFAKEVPCSNIPYHSRYIAPAGPKLLAYLNEVIPQPQPRSKKWVSSSVPRNKWSTAAAKLSSAEYHTNNLLSPVLFEETARMIPKEAVTIEIAPHGLLQAILRRSLGSGVTNVALTQRGHKDNVDVFLQAIGKLYNAGLQPDIAILYPPVEYPVSAGTPMISPSIRWEHSDDWYVTSFKMQKKTTSGERVVSLSLANEDDKYMIGHVIDGQNLIPAMGYLAMIWETIGILYVEMYTEVSVVFEDVNFTRVIHIPKDGEVQLSVMVQKGTGRFEITEGNSAVVTGFIRVVKNPTQEKVPASLLPEDDDEEEVMNTKDIYKELRLRGYQYSGSFCSLKSASISGKKGHITWAGNWVTFIDNMLQIMMLGMDTKSLYVPTKIQKIVIDTKLHQQEGQNLNSEDKQFPVHVYKEWEVIMSGGVEIRGVKATAIPRRPPAKIPVLEEYKFVAHRDRAQVSLKEAIRLSTHIAIECHQSIHVKTIELIDDSDNVTVDKLASPVLTEILDDLPLIQPKVYLSAPSNRFDNNSLPSNVIPIDMSKVPKEENILLAVGIGLLSRNKTQQLENILSKLKNGGFILTRERLSKFENLSSSSKHDLNVILEKSIGEETIVLLKKKKQLARKTEIIHVKNDQFTWLEKLNSLMNAKSEAVDMRVILIGEGELESGLLGFVNCLRKEPGGEIIRSVLIQDTKAPKFSLQNILYWEQLQLDLPINVLRPGKEWGSYRYQPLPGPQPKLVCHAYANQMTIGDLSSLRWIEGPIRPDSNQKDLVHVAYSSLNFRDMMLSTGKLAKNNTSFVPSRFDDCIIGLEYAGIDTTGRRVMGLSCRGKAITNVIEADRRFCWYVPDNWSLEDAATVPCVYATCYMALYHRADMKEGDKVLIHSGTSSVGQAAINLALHEGCEVFTTVGTPEKRKFIRELFPSIPDNHISSSRDTSFEQIILQQTNGNGVDIVLNSLTKEKLQASVRCLAQGGRFLEIGKFDLAANNPLGMMIFLKEVSFHGISFDNLFVSTAEEETRELHDMVNKGLKNGVIKPLVRKVFEKDELETAFKYMAAGKHIGKILVKVCDEKKVLEKKPILAEPRYYCDSNKTYLILGGLGGFGLELAGWLISRGAKNLVLTSRTGIKNGYQRLKVEQWKSYGVNVLIVTGADASSHKDCEFILNSAEKQGPVDAIFNLAVVLKDSVCKNQTPKSFEECFRAKAYATKMLDKLSRSLCPQLQQFVVFSSVSCGRGNAGQTNYGMANSVMERICERRAANGLPGLAIQWGSIGEVGLVAEWQDNNKELIGGTLQQRVSSCLEKLDNFLLQNRPVVSSMMVAEKCVHGTVNIVETVADIMGIKDLKSVAPNTSLAELGIDSIKSVQIKQTVEREFDVLLTARDIHNLSFAKLSEMCDEELEREQAQAQQITEQTAAISGIQLIVRLVSEKLSTETCMELQTRMDPRKIKVFLLPGIQGCGQLFNPLASKIRPIAAVLQYGITNNGRSHMSIPEYADFLLPYILPKAEEQRGFAIVGYSFGSLIAIELVKRLEKRGLSGRLVLIDGAPEILKTVIEQFLPSATEGELQNNILLAIMDTMQSALSEKLLLDLEKCTTWEEKLNSFVSHVPDNEMVLSVADKKTLCTAIYMNILALRKYDFSSLERLRTPITLLKPTLKFVDTIDEDYGLHKVTRDRVEVHYVEGNHVTMLNSNMVIRAINGELLQDYKEFRKLLSEDRPFEYEDEERTA
ncbi:PREDICTED: fatty acid synthase [Vollenhovia emeryi]|uniref:fatty acid synthase n=1 Tax=Vollenhovia emeryi TaxID=411798 RepID=UPI0005F4BECF|nr:PREDICTED: fatty acid synthase [Vollenhovia emeryi]XP_011878073.1 PREDICTED: fatty acid synthase [Vollenhovia emeryi]XP_011878074.1 PREDICTED: fatty acid synthase [Vollenhovia emeryi]